MADRGWGRPFDDPIRVDGRKLVTLREAATFITKLPKREHDAPEWQAYSCPGQLDQLLTSRSAHCFGLGALIGGRSRAPT